MASSSSRYEGDNKPFSIFSGVQTLLESGGLDEGPWKSVRRASLELHPDACIQTEHDKFQTWIPSPFLEKTQFLHKKKRLVVFFRGVEHPKNKLVCSTLYHQHFRPVFSTTPNQVHRHTPRSHAAEKDPTLGMIGWQV